MKRSCGVEVEHVCVFLAVRNAVNIKKARILRTESRLHVERGTLHIREYEHARPFGNGNSRRQLPDGKRNRLVVVFDGVLHLQKRIFDIAVERFIVVAFAFLVELSVARRQNDFIVLKARVIA